jgi:hypothetical protein
MPCAGDNPQLWAVLEATMMTAWFIVPVVGAALHSAADLCVIPTALLSWQPMLICHRKRARDFRAVATKLEKAYTKSWFETPASVGSFSVLKKRHDGLLLACSPLALFQLHQAMSQAASTFHDLLCMLLNAAISHQHLKRAGRTLSSSCRVLAVSFVVRRQHLLPAG